MPVTLNQRITALAMCGHPADNVAKMLAIPVKQVKAEIQDLSTTDEIDVLGLGSASAGSIVCTYIVNGVTYTTASIAWNATTAQVVAAFNAATGSTPLPGTWSGTGGPLPANVTLTFDGSYPVTGQTVTPTGLTGGTAAFTRSTPAVEVTQSQRVHDLLAAGLSRESVGYYMGIAPSAVDTIAQDLNAAPGGQVRTGTP